MSRLFASSIIKRVTFSSLHLSQRGLKATGVLFENDYYKILNVQPTSTQAEIRQSYQYLTEKHDPRKFRDEDPAPYESRLREITKAYLVLSDVKTKRLYDKGIHVEPENLMDHLNKESQKREYLSVLHTLPRLDVDKLSAAYGVVGTKKIDPTKEDMQKRYDPVDDFYGIKAAVCWFILISYFLECFYTFAIRPLFVEE